ncbi:hypothetical protein M426DRAFT_140131 [Hypoxylon sp. CI-4A]|nr:hypothetical protein M426DRAFT_140131 [Hypoxylon sp. CI-4A]
MLGGRLYLYHQTDLGPARPGPSRIDKVEGLLRLCPNSTSCASSSPLQQLKHLSLLLFRTTPHSFIIIIILILSLVEFCDLQNQYFFLFFSVLALPLLALQGRILRSVL